VQNPFLSTKLRGRTLSLGGTGPLVSSGIARCGSAISIPSLDQGILCDSHRLDDKIWGCASSLTGAPDIDLTAVAMDNLSKWMPTSHLKADETEFRRLQYILLQ
jgi:hypothetical protein